MKAPGLRRLAALALALFGLVSGSASAARDLAGELKDAQAALAAGDYPRAYQAYLDHSKNNSLAQFSLGLFHHYGWGRPVDRAEACRWQEKATQGNIPGAQLYLADCLRRGVHKSADPAAAAYWYEQAALSGIFTASCTLAEMYMAGEGVSKNPRKAIELCRSAADKGLPAAQIRLSGLYLDGDAAVRNPAAALQWMQSAAQANDPEAQYRLGLMLRDGIGKPADVASARWWLESAAGQGWLPAYLPTAALYLNAPTEPDTGLLPAADLAKAYLWSAAASRRLTEGTATEDARALLTKVLARMPETWRADLDRRVAEHLARVRDTSGQPSASP